MIYEKLVTTITFNIKSFFILIGVSSKWCKSFALLGFIMYGMLQFQYFHVLDKIWRAKIHKTFCICHFDRILTLYFIHQPLLLLRKKSKNEENCFLLLDDSICIKHFGSTSCSG